MSRTRRQLLVPFVPRLALELGEREGSLHVSIEGSMLSADISGFTTLSERQSAKGKAGAEHLADLISACFTDLIDAAYAHAGEIIKFGGDALLVLFRGDGHERRSAGAGLAMQRALASSTAARRAELTMSVGIAVGPFDTFLVGTTRRELLIIGREADRVIRLESDAAKGETLVSPAIAAQFAESDIVGEHHGGLVLSPELDLPGRSITDRVLPDVELDRYVPTPVSDQLEGFAELGGEHRFATVGFLMATGIAALIDADPMDAARELGALVDRVVAAGDRFAVAPLETDISDDGFKFVLSAGAPLTVGNTSDALLHTALDILRHETPLELRLGAQTGRVFAGFIGHPHRWTYTMMGDCMSTAARMLGRAADREIIAVADVIDDTRAPFATAPLEPFRVKGKSEPVTAVRVIDEVTDAGRSSSDVVLFGVDEHVNAATAALAQPGANVSIVGVGGSGKTALVDAILDATNTRDEATDIQIARVVAHQHGGTGPYSDLRPIVRKMLGIAADSPQAEAGERLRSIAAAHAPQLDRLVPLIADVIGAITEPTPESDAIGSDFRRARTVAVVAELLRSLPGSEGFVVVVDDAQWLDESSTQLLGAIGVDAGTQPWSTLTARRPDSTPVDAARPVDDADPTEAERVDGAGPIEAGPADESIGVDSDDATTCDDRSDDDRDPAGDRGRGLTIRLEPLGSEEIRRMAIERSTRALSDDELRAVIDRAEGNPLFAVELVRAIATQTDGTLPGSIEKLIATRIDALRPAVRRLVRLAAVIGRDFDTATLASLTGAETEADVRRQLRAELADMVVGHGDDRWGFRQAIHREVAYEALPYRERRRLHAAVGEQLEASIVADIDEFAAALSLHWAEAHEHERAWTFGRIAGERAMRSSSTGDAIEAFQRALDSGRHARSVTKRQRSRIATRLGDAAELAGRYDVATSSYAVARRLLAVDDPDQVELFRKCGVVHEHEGHYERAVRWYRRGVEAAFRLDHAAPHEASELAVAIAGIRYRQARYDDCRHAAQPVADDIGAPATTRLRACYVIQVATQYLGDRDARDRYGELGSRLAELVEEPVLEANLFNNLGISAYYEGDWDRAADLYGESLEQREAAGDLIGAVTSLNNIGEVRSDQRRFDEAEQLFSDALRRATAAGYEMAIHVVRANLGRLATRRGRTSDAREILHDALVAFENIDASGFALETRLRLVEADAADGPDAVDAVALRELLDDNDRLGGGATIAVPVRRLLAAHLRRRGDASDASVQIESALEMARDGRLDVEIAACLDELAEQASVQAQDGDTDVADAARVEASAIRRRLGIV